MDNNHHFSTSENNPPNASYVSDLEHLYSTVHIGEVIRRVRRAKELSQQFVADQMGLAISYISKIENGKSDPDSELIKRFAAVLEVPVSELFVDDKPPAAVHFSRSGHSTTTEDVDRVHRAQRVLEDDALHDLVRMWEGLTEGDKKFLLEFSRRISTHEDRGGSDR